MASTLALTALMVGGLLTPVVPPIGPSSSEPPPAVQPSGSTRAPDGVLRKGCRRYSFDYTVTTQHDDWTLETSIRDRTGRAVASHALLGPGDPKAGRKTFTLCRWSTRPGRFRIRAKLTSYDSSQGSAVQLPVSTFRLRQRR